jgi:hypothetical protein
MKAYFLAFAIIAALGGVFVANSFFSPPAMADNAQ